VPAEDIARLTRGVERCLKLAFEGHLERVYSAAVETIDVALGVLAHPGEGVHPGVVLVHDVWGVTDHTRDLARRLAADGFAVLALDLYRNKGDFRIDAPGPWMRSLSDPEAVADVREAAAFLARHPASNGRPAAVIGFCMGGMVALLAACAVPELAAAVPFYGLLSHEHGLLFADAGLDPEKKPRQPLDAVVDLLCPLLCFFGAEDEFVPMSDIERLEQRLTATEIPTEVVVYPDAGHAFMNDARADAYRPEAARDAWARMTAFLRAHLEAGA
jgi:carboxymethylenebutenolidase